MEKTAAKSVIKERRRLCEETCLSHIVFAKNNIVWLITELRSSCLASSATIFVLSEMQMLFLDDGVFFPALPIIVGGGRLTTTLRKCMKLFNRLAEK